MKTIAPNLTQLVGTVCASQLILLAGGVEQLSRMPSCNIQVMGSKRVSSLGFSHQGQGLHRGVFGNLEIVQQTPAQFQTIFVRKLSSGVANAIKVDFLRTCPDGSAGRRIKTKTIDAMNKIMDQKPNRAKKIVPAPDDKPSKRRGGRKFQKIKEKFALTEVRKNQNRLSFGTEAEDEYRLTGKGYGMLSQSQGIGKIKIQQSKAKLKNSKAMQKRLLAPQNQVQGGTNGLNQPGGGIYSTIAMTPIQGMELKSKLVSSLFFISFLFF